MKDEVTTRTTQTEAPFIMPVSVPFTGVEGELAIVYTEPPLSVGAVSAVDVLGMMTDLESATALFTRNTEGIWSSNQIPLAMNFGKPGSAKPIIWLERPLSLARGQRIRGDLINVDAEGPGTLFFYCRRRDDMPRVSIPEDVGEPDDLIIESALTGVADERPARATSPILEEDFLVRGLHTNLNNATVRLFGVDGIPWSENPVNVWAVAGRAADAVRVMQLHKPYLIPAGTKIAAEFVNGRGADVDPSGQIFLKGLRFPAVRTA